MAFGLVELSQTTPGSLPVRPAWTLQVDSIIWLMGVCLDFSVTPCDGSQQLALDVHFEAVLTLSFFRNIKCFPPFVIVLVVGHMEPRLISHLICS